MAIFSMKCCATCQYWDGNRKVSAFKDKSEVKYMSDEGACLNNKSASSRGKKYRADHPSNCNHYVRWDQLK